MPFLYETAGRYICACLFDDRELPQDAGFRFNKERREFWSTDPKAAYRLIKYAHDDVKNYLNTRFAHLLPIKYSVSATQLKASSAFTLQVKRYQVRGALHILRNSSSYLWYEAGTGKTATATLALEYLSKKGFFNVVVCPAFLANTWREEIARVSRDFLDVHILKSKDDDFSGQTDVLIVPDSLLTPELEIKLAGYNLGAFIIDEGHRFKNETSGRCKWLTDREDDAPSKWSLLFRHVCVMSGTPLPNHKPIELWPVLNAFAPWAIGFRNKLEYGIRYCGGKMKADGYGFDYSGATNIEELISNLKDSGYLIYQELLESDVQTQAEDQYIYLDPSKEDKALIQGHIDLAARLPLEDILALAIAEDKNLARKYDFKLKLKGAALAPSEFMAELRKLAGVSTCGVAAPVISEVITSEKKPVVIFAWHKDVITLLKDKLEKFNPLVIDGSVPKGKRQGIVDTFQAEGSTRPLIVNIAAGGVGFTMTKAYKCFFVEFSYVEGENDQAVKRLSRLGQTRQVVPYYFIFKNSLAHTMLGVLSKKQKNKAVIKAALKEG